MAFLFSMKKVFIYSLNCPITNMPRYIGKTNNIDKRFKGHYNIKSLSYKTHKNHWLKSLIKQNLKPIIEIIDEVNINEWEFWEQHYISLYKSWNIKLTNTTIGGDGKTGCSTSEETKFKMSMAHKQRWDILGRNSKKFKINSNGFYKWSKEAKLRATNNPNNVGNTGMTYTQEKKIKRFNEFKKLYNMNLSKIEICNQMNISESLYCSYRKELQIALGEYKLHQHESKIR